MSAKLSKEDFLKSFEFAPRLAIELLIENPKGELLLIKREHEPFIGDWHVPGGFLLKDEPINDCIRRLAKEELGLEINPKKTERLGLFETIGKDPRGHILHYPVRIKMSDIDDENYFSVIPRNTISFHLDFLEKLSYKLE